MVTAQPTAVQAVATTQPTTVQAVATTQTTTVRAVATMQPTAVPATISTQTSRPLASPAAKSAKLPLEVKAAASTPLKISPGLGLASAPRTPIGSVRPAARQSTGPKRRSSRHNPARSSLSHGLSVTTTTTATSTSTTAIVVKAPHQRNGMLRNTKTITARHTLSHSHTHTHTHTK